LQAGGRRFDPVNLHQTSNLSHRLALPADAMVTRLRFDRFDHWLFLFFNNLEEVVKNLSAALVRL
jgi:hypothetical protein